MSGGGRAEPAGVLLVDDSALVRVTVRIHAEQDPRLQVVGEADNGSTALRQAKALHPDVIVLDNQMPVRTGLEVLPELREAAPDAVIVVYTSDDDAALRKAALDAGASAVLIKGRDTIDDVIDVVSRLSAWASD